MHLHIEYGVMLVYIIYGGFIIFIYLFLEIVSTYVVRF